MPVIQPTMMPGEDWGALQQGFQSMTNSLLGIIMDKKKADRTRKAIKDEQEFRTAEREAREAARIKENKRIEKTNADILGEKNAAAAKKNAYGTFATFSVSHLRPIKDGTPEDYLGKAQEAAKALRVSEQMERLTGGYSEDEFNTYLMGKVNDRMTSFDAERSRLSPVQLQQQKIGETPPNINVPNALGTGDMGQVSNPEYGAEVSKLNAMQGKAQTEVDKKMQQMLQDAIDNKPGSRENLNEFIQAQGGRIANEQVSQGKQKVAMDKAVASLMQTVPQGKTDEVGKKLDPSQVAWIGIEKNWSIYEKKFAGSSNPALMQDMFLDEMALKYPPTKYTVKGENDKPYSAEEQNTKWAQRLQNMPIPIALAFARTGDPVAVKVIESRLSGGEKSNIPVDMSSLGTALQNRSAAVNRGQIFGEKELLYKVFEKWAKNGEAFFANASRKELEKLLERLTDDVVADDERLTALQRTLKEFFNRDASYRESHYGSQVFETQHFGGSPPQPIIVNP